MWLVRAAALPSVWVFVVLPVYRIAFSVSVPSMERYFPQRSMAAFLLLTEN